MTRIHVLGGTGFAGSKLVQEAAARGHRVTSYSRSLPDDTADGVQYRTGDLRDQEVQATVFDDVDVVVSALSPRGDMADDAVFRGVLQDTARLAAEKGVRLGVIGGAGSLLTEKDGHFYAEDPEFPEFARAESHTLGAVLEDLRANDDERLDWFLISPAAHFGAQAPGTRTGHYRVGGDVLVRDENGESAISGDDLAIAIVDEIEQPAHHRTRFTVGY